jgi:hypothetical protein
MIAQGGSIFVRGYVPIYYTIVYNILEESPEQFVSNHNDGYNILLEYMESFVELIFGKVISYEKRIDGTVVYQIIHPEMWRVDEDEDGKQRVRMNPFYLKEIKQELGYHKKIFIKKKHLLEYPSDYLEREFPQYSGVAVQCALEQMCNEGFFNWYDEPDSLEVGIARADTT